MPLLPSRFDSLDYLYANPQIQQDFTSWIAKTEATRGTAIYDFLATQNGLATLITRGLNVSNISKGVRRHQEPGGVATVQRAGRLTLLFGHCNKRGCSHALDIMHEGA